MASLLRIGARGSPLSLAQTQRVRARIATALEVSFDQFTPASKEGFGAAANCETVEDRARAIERAQKQVEGQNFTVRKHLLEYDDVMNKQREVIYRHRRAVLGGDSLTADLRDIQVHLALAIVEHAIGQQLGQQRIGFLAGVAARIPAAPGLARSRAATCSASSSITGFSLSMVETLLPRAIRFSSWPITVSASLSVDRLRHATGLPSSQPLVSAAFEPASSAASAGE